MRKWKCIRVNRGNKDNFTVGKIYETDDDMLNCRTDNGYVLFNIPIIEPYDADNGLVFEEVKEFDWNAFESENLAVHCRAEEEAIDFCKQMAKRDLKWKSDDWVMASKTYWNEYKERMVYGCDNGVCYGTEDSGFKESEYEFIEWSDYMKNEFTKADLKSGMVIVRRNGDACGLFDTKEGLSVQDHCESRCCTVKQYSNELKNIMSNNLDIMEVYDIAEEVFEFTTENRELLWKRVEKSPTQIKLEELEKKQREIADEIKKVREEL